MKKIIKVGGFSLLNMLLTLPVLAAGPTGSEITGANVDLRKGRITEILGGLRDWIAGLIAIVAVIMILYAAFLYMTAGGDEDKIGTAKKTLMYGIIGVGVSLIAYSIFSIVKSFLQ